MSNLAFVVFVQVPVAWGGSGIILTVAGGGVGDGGPATLATLNTPFGVTVDAAGNLFIADAGNNRIHKVVASTGIITTVAGTGVAGFSGDGGLATSAQLNSPAGVAVDAAGDLFIADYLNNRIRKVAAGTGIITTVAGTGVYGFSGDGGPATLAMLSQPSSVTVDAASNLFIADYLNNRIRKVAPATGIITTVAGTGVAGFWGDGGPATLAGLNGPLGVTVDAAGNLFIADISNNRIRRVTAGTGIITTVAGTGAAGFGGDGGPATSAQLYAPYGVAVDAAGDLFIADTYNNRIRRVAAGTGIITTVAGAGVYGFSGDGGLATLAALSNPSGTTVDAAGNLFIADAGNNRIRQVAAATGIITTVAGGGAGLGDGGPATLATLSNPFGVTVDAAGDLFIADQLNNRIRKVAAGTGIITTVAGTGVPGFSGDGGLATSAQLNHPIGVAVDAAGNFFIADDYNNRIRKVAAGAGIITTVAGTGVPGFSGDGGPATLAEFAAPAGVTVDTAGNLFVADEGNNRIREVAAATGIITTVAGGGGAGLGDGGPATLATLNQPFGVTVDAAGDLFIADTGNNRIRKVAAATGIITTVAGTGVFGFSGDGGPATLATLSNPFGVAFDATGNLFIEDTNNDRIRRVAAATGIITTVAGTGIPGFSGDGGPATLAQLQYPRVGIVVDAAGDLLIADTYNNRVRAVGLHVAALPPVITSGPPSPTIATSATFTFVAVEPGVVQFSCRLDAGGATPCSSPQSYAGPLALGAHTFQVTATDQFGDTSAPSTYTWTITKPFTLTLATNATTFRTGDSVIVSVGVNNPGLATMPFR